MSGFFVLETVFEFIVCALGDLSAKAHTITVYQRFLIF